MTQKCFKIGWLKVPLIGFVVAVTLFGLGFSTQAIAQTRIVVLPFYTEEGTDASRGGNAEIHYRRMMRFINNQLVRHDFEVINAFAKEGSEREYNRVMERAREDSVLAAQDMCKKYAVDAAYIVWLNVKVRQTSDGYCKAAARLDGEGYDSGGRDLGVGVSKTFKVTKRDCDDAIAEVEKEVGDLVGRKLTAWSGGSTSPSTVTGGGGGGGSYGGGYSTSSGGALARNTQKFENLINVKLDGATEYELAEVFGKVVNTATGVVEAKRYGSRIVPDNPQASFVTWRVRTEDTDPFRLQSNIIKMINDILDAGGEIVMRGVPYRYTAAEVDLLKGIRPGDTTSREIQFVVDRELARDREFSGRHDPYKARENQRQGGGFE
jgi:uncharacterized membrane protein YgcG